MTQGALHLLFHMGGDAYALNACEVLEVLPQRSLKRLPEAPPWLVGIFMRHGEPVPVIDLALRTFATPAAARSSTRLVLVRCGAGGEERPRVIGLLLEQATETLRLQAETLRDTGLTGAPWLGPLYQGGGRLVQAIRVNELLPQTGLFQAESEARP